MRWKDEKDHFEKQRNITLKVRKFRIELSQLGNNFGFLNRFIWYFKLLEPRKNIKILLFLPWTSEPHSLQRSSGCRPALQWSEFECKWTFTYKGEYFNVKMTGSPGQTWPLIWIYKSSSWEKICKLIFFQMPVGIWWHWVSRGHYLLVLGGTGSVLGGHDWYLNVLGR